MANSKENIEPATEEQVLANFDKVEANESALGEPEPWEAWETQLCLWSLFIGIGGLVVLGTLINIFLLTD